MKTTRRLVRTVLALLGLGVMISVFQNCAPEGQFQTFEEETSLDLASSTAPPAAVFCTSSTGAQLAPGQTLQGFSMSSALYPQLCGAQVTRTCLSSGSFDGPISLSATCQQQCVHPDNNQAVNADFQFNYYTKSTGITQAECDAARVTSRCQATTGLFNPTIAANRFSSCLVQGQTCAYAISSGSAVPNGNMMGATVTGFVLPSATYPMLCGNQITRTCQANGAWSGSVPIYMACAQKCLHPDTQQPVDSGSQFAYYTRSSGTEVECLSSRKVSSCQMSSGLFSPAVENLRFTSCQIQTPPPTTSEPNMPLQFSTGSLRVCSEASCPYRLPSQAHAAAQNGSVIEIMSGSYEDCVSITKNNLTIRGVGPTRPHLHTKICGGKGILVNMGSNNRFENLELSNFQNSEYNGAAFRQDAAGKNVIIQNFYFHDGQFGIMGGSAGDRIYVTDSKFDKVGVLRPDGEISVPIFMNAGDLLEIRKSFFTQAVGGASFIKSRALKTVVDCSSVAALDSADSYNIDYQTGGEFVLTNSVIQQGTRTENNNMITINSVSYSAAITNSLFIKGNVFLNDFRRGTILNIARTLPPQVQVIENLFIGGGSTSNILTIDSTNTVLADRPVTIGAYPKLPLPGACSTATP